MMPTRPNRIANHTRRPGIRSDAHPGGLTSCSFLSLVRSVSCIISREHSVFRAPVNIRPERIASRERIAMTPQRSRTVVGTFHFGLEAERALRKLRTAGFGRNEIGVAMRRADKGGKGAPNGYLDQRTSPGASSTTLNGMDLNALLALGVQSGVVPGVGPAIATGPLRAIFSDSAGNNGTSRLVRALEVGGVAATLAAHYQDEFEGGRVIVTVDAGDRSREATDILLDGGAYLMTSRESISILT